MRRFAVVAVVSVMTLGTIGTTVGVAGASVPTASKFCKSLSNIDTGDIGNPLSDTEAATTVKQLKKVERAAKGKVKKSVGEIIDAYQDIADGESARDAFGNADFLKAITTFGIATGKCILDGLPDVTTPTLG